MSGEAVKIRSGEGGEFDYYPVAPKSAGGPDTGETYYHHWLATPERVVAEKGVTDASQLARTRHAWEHACERTPHGTPIELRPGDFHD
jgi:hypothetical protein